MMGTVHQCPGQLDFAVPEIVRQILLSEPKLLVLKQNNDFMYFIM